MSVLVREGVVEADDLVFEELYDDLTGQLIQVRLSGNVTCYSGAKVRVLKWMETRARDGGVEVLTVFYQYQAWLPRVGRRREQPLVRYDQAHGGQPHRHEFDPLGKDVAHQNLTFETMPRLDAVIREAAGLAAAFDSDPR